MKQIKRSNVFQLAKLLAAAVMIGMVSATIAVAQTTGPGGTLRPFGQTVNHGYTQTRVMPSNRTQAQMNQDVADQFNRILSRFIVDPTHNTAGHRSTFRMVLNHATGTGNVGDDGVTVCEAHGFGMVMLAYMAGAEDMMVPSNPTNLSSTRVPLRRRLWENLPANLRGAFHQDSVTIKHYFDACFRTMKQFPATNNAAANGRYLMAWQIRGRAGPWTTTGISMSTATDGALDMTYALLVADRQWGGNPHGRTNTNGGNATTNDSEYLYWSRGAMRQLLLSSVNRDVPTASTATHTMTVGNWVGGNNRRITRPSDFMITHWRSFASVGNAVTSGSTTSWAQVISGTNRAINEGAHGTTGLLPDFLWYGSPNTAQNTTNDWRWRPLGASPSDGLSHWNENVTNDSRYAWNACRVPWRIGLDILHTGTTSPINAVVRRMNDSMNSRTGTRFSAIRGGPLTGELTGSSGRGFSAPYLVTAAAYGPVNWMTNGWDWARAINVSPDNYNCYIMVLSMIAASGNWWCPITPLGNVTTHRIGASPATVDFGSLLTGYTQPAAQTITITNTGNTNITLNALPPVANYTLTPSANWTTAMTPNQTRTFTIRPNASLAAGTHNRTFNVTGNNNTSVTINANFTVAQTINSIGAAPATLDFGTLQTGYTPQPAAQTVTITNTGNTNVTLNALPTVANYTLTPGANWTTAMQPNQTRTFTVRPNAGLAAGTYNRTINVTGSNNTSVSVNANFAVTQPIHAIIVSPSTLNFGSLETPYTQPAAQTVTVTNDGNANVTLNALPAVTGYTLTAGANWTSAMTPGTFRTFTVRPNAGLAAGAHNRTFNVTGSNSTTASVSANFTVTTATPILFAPEITTQPTNQSITAGQNATFTVVATGNPEPTFQWQLSTNNGSTWAPIEDETDASLTITNATIAQNNHRFRVIVTNSQGNVTSNAATLTVGAALIAPSFTEQPVSKTVSVGQNAIFTVAVEGSPTPTIQWQSRPNSSGTWANITGATGLSYTLETATLAQNGMQFRARASNTAQSNVASDIATLTVNASDEAEKTAVGFVYLFTASTPEQWVGFNNAVREASIEFDITVDAYHTLTLPAWPEGGTGALHASHRDIYLAQPTLTVNPARKPVSIHSIRVNGTAVTTAMPTQAAAPARWLVASTIGTVNPVTTTGAIATAAANANAFDAAGLELRTFQLSQNAFQIPDDAIVEIVFRVGEGGATSIRDVTSSDSRYGIRFAQNIVSERAEISVILPNDEKAVETKIAVYDMTGNVVWMSTTRRVPAVWDLTNSAGRFVANGTYLVIAEVKDRKGRVYTYSARLGVNR